MDRGTDDSKLRSGIGDRGSGIGGFKHWVFQVQTPQVGQVTFQCDANAHCTPIMSANWQRTGDNSNAKLVAAADS